MKRKAILGLVALICAMLAGLGSRNALAQASSTAIRYLGWNLVAFPPGTDLSSLPGPLYTLQPGGQNYQTVNPSQGTVSGFGYWAYFNSPTIVTLGVSSASSYQVSVPAGQWVMVGDPSDTASVRVSGASFVFLYDASGGAYRQHATLQPGEGAFVYSAAGGTVQLSPAPAVTSCGTISTSGLGPGATTTGTPSPQQAESCFAQAFQTCGPVSLTESDTGIDAIIKYVFMLDNSGGLCTITVTVTETVFGLVPPTLTRYSFCTSVSQTAGGLAFTGCGSQGTVTAPPVQPVLG